jgi:hypothetical protein
VNPFAQRENARTLAAAVGIDETDATELLNVSVAITFSLNDVLSAECANHIQRLLSRTIKGVALNPLDKSRGFSAEVVVGESTPRFKGPHVFVNIGTEKILVARWKNLKTVDLLTFSPCASSRCRAIMAHVSCFRRKGSNRL